MARLLMTLLLAAAAVRNAAAVEASRRAIPVYAKWSKIELAFHGPASRSDGDPNPFAVELAAVFTSPGGRRWRIPGFYDGDGRGGPDGDVWKIRFSADEPGRWTWTTESDLPQLAGRTGRFQVVPPPAEAAGFWKWGRLAYVGTPENELRYLKFQDGPYWLKAGCDDPENFLGGCRNYDTPAERKAAIDHLARRGVNSLYMMTHNLRGDNNDVWPWLGATPEQAMAHGGPDARFDVPRLEAWRELFEHMQTRGVVPYLVLEDDSAWSGYDHRRYYRELIARFGYLPALLFNFGEEHNENYSLAEALDYMRLLEQLDPYDHPRGVHNVNRPDDRYVDAEQVDFTSIQTGSPGTRKGVESALEHNRIAIDWIERCRRRGRRVLMVNFDEARPEEDRRCWWSVYLGGGVWESHVREPYDRPMSAWDPVWRQLGGARTYMESLPFWRMAPRNDLVREGRAMCLAAVGEAYALYLPKGGEVAVELAGGRYEIAWWNPANDRRGRFAQRAVIEGGRRRIRAPGEGDWAARIVRK